MTPAARSMTGASELSAGTLLCSNTAPVGDTDAQRSSKIALARVFSRLGGPTRGTRERCTRSRHWLREA